MKTSAIAMFNRITLPVCFILVTSGYLPSAVCAKTCGAERWSIKTLSDPLTNHVDMTPVIHTTINELTAGDKHCKNLPDERTFPEEFHVYEVKGVITYAAFEDDRDVHIAIEDPEEPHETMIVEIVDPTCPGAKSSMHKAKLKAARQKFTNDILGDGGLDSLVGVTVRVRGVGFFDRKHGQTGRSRTCLELHPVLQIEAVP